MASVITWKIANSVLGEDDNLILTIKELLDGIESGRVYSARVHKDYPQIEARLKAILKEKIINDRTKIKASNAEIEKVNLFDFSNFETFIKN